MWYGRPRSPVANLEVMITTGWLLLLVMLSATADRPVASPPPQPVAQAENEKLARQWLDQAVVQAGGHDAWSRIATASLEYHAVSFVLPGTDSVVSHYVEHWDFPRRWLGVTDYPPSPGRIMVEMREGYDGSRGWMSTMNERRDRHAKYWATPGGVTDSPLAATHAIQGYERSLFRLFEHSDSIRALALPETVSFMGVPCRAVVAESKVLPEWQIFFAMDGRLEGPRYRQPLYETSFATRRWRSRNGTAWERSKSRGE